MMNADTAPPLISVQKLTEKDLPIILPLVHYLDTTRAINTLEKRYRAMFSYPNHVCFGLLEQQELRGVASVWITERLYSGKQAELDNVIIDPTHQNRGLGAEFVSHLQSWAIDEGCLSLELNTYVNNSHSHQFYFKEGFRILGFHFMKSIVSKKEK